MQAKAVSRFTAEEARAKIGQHVETLTEFAGVPKGTPGTVVDVHEFGPNSFDVVIEWKSPFRIGLQDRFAKGPYEEYLLEEDGELAFAV